VARRAAPRIGGIGAGTREVGVVTIRPTHSAVSRDRWLISYADFMTLLCAFFTALYAASLAETRAALAAAAEPSATPRVPAVVAPPLPAAPAIDRAAALRVAIETALEAELSAGYLQLVDDRRGLVIEVPEAGAFAVGQAELVPEAVRMLTRVAAMLATLPNAVRVEGHTDDRPIRTSVFASNWDLSTARATRVVAFLVTEGRVAPARLSAAGYAEFKPRGDNGTADGRARNRRVDLVVLNEATTRAEEPGSGAEPR
jgi:chemotaxis protein MotB